MICEPLDWCGCGRRRAEGRAMCLGCMEAQLNKNTVARQTREFRDDCQAEWAWERAKARRDDRLLYDYAMTRADHAD